MRLLLQTIVLFSSLLLLSATELPLAGSQIHAAEQKKERKTRKTPALRERVYSQLARAQKLADDGNVAEGMAILETIKGRQKQMNSYEKAMLWNFIAFIEYSQEKIPEAVAAFKNVVAQENIPESLEMSTVFSLAQLSMSLENYAETLTYLDRWENLASEKTSRASAFTLRANALYANKQFVEALTAIDSAIADLEDGKLPKENWLVLKRALHYELKQTPKVAETTEQLVRLYSKPKYWVELANLYGELGDDDRHLAVMEAAYQQGYVEKSADFQTLAQLYFYAGAPYKSAKVLDKAIEKKAVVPNLKVYTFLAQSWEQAKELDKAITVLKDAIGLTNDHALLQKVARLYIDLEQWDNALEYANKAENIIEHIENPGNIYVAKGIALLNLNEFEEAITAFSKAKSIKDTSKVATQWIQYVQREQELFNTINKVADVGA